MGSKTSRWRAFPSATVRVGSNAVRCFTALFCGNIGLQTLIHFPNQLSFYRTRPELQYGPPPRLLRLISLPGGSEGRFKIAGALFVLALFAAAGNFVSPFSLAVALVAYFLYFPPILSHALVRRKTNLIPQVLAILLLCPEQSLFLVKLVLSLTYLLAGIEKLRMAGVRWADGRSLQAYLLQNYLYNQREITLWLAQKPVLCRLLSSVVLIWEMTFWIVLPFPGLAWIYVPVGLLLHAGIAVTMRIHYWVYFVPVYWVFAAPFFSRLL